MSLWGYSSHFFAVALLESFHLPLEARKIAFPGVEHDDRKDEKRERSRSGRLLPETVGYHLGDEMGCRSDKAQSLVP